MPLKDILLKVSAEIYGSKLSTTADRDLIVRKINSAAKELYDSQDLIGSLREQVFNADLTDNWQITLPYYVQHIRGVRTPCKMPTKLEDMLPRYISEDWSSHSMSWRKKHITPLSHTLDAASKLTFTLSGIETEDVIIYITGSTPTAQRTTETVIIAAGLTSVTTLNNYVDFPGITVIRKKDLTTYNISITNDANVEVGFLPNCELEARNTIIQVVNGCCTPTNCGISGCKCWEILYKLHFIPFSGDFDEFPCEGYDDAIFWKCAELWWATQDGKQETAILANQKCTSIIEQIAADAKKGQILKFDFGKNKYANMHWWDRRMITPISMTQGIYPVYPGIGTNYGGGGCGC